MAEQPAPTELHPAPPEPDEPDEPLLDRIDALRVLRADSPEERGRLLEEIGGTGRVEQDIPLVAWRVFGGSNDVTGVADLRR
jgi:hypothetical protein